MARTNQPTYDFLTGADTSPPPRLPVRDALKQSTVSRAETNNEDIRAQLRTAQYELDSVKQERELTELRHQQELRDLQGRAEADFNRAQTAESASAAATKKAEALARDFQELQDQASNERAQFEKRARSLQDDNRILREELEDARSELSSQERTSKHALSELEQKHATLRASVEDIQQDLTGKVTALQTTQQKLVQREAEVGELENEVLRLKAQTGDSDTLAVIKKELSEQVAYIKKLESTNRDHVAEIKQFRKVQKGIEVVEEEKLALEAKVRMMDDLRKELGEAQLQKRILEDEKKAWTSYLENETPEEHNLRYDTPEQLAKAFLQERLERISLVDKLGAIQPELLVKDESIRSLQDEKAKLSTELEQLRSTESSGTSTSRAHDSKARARLERQKTLMSKEIEYLRAQMKAFEAEETEFTPEQIDTTHTQRIHELQTMLEQYRTEVQTLQAELSSLELPPPSVPTPAPTSQKRARGADDDAAADTTDADERLGGLQRRTRTLQTELEQSVARVALLEAELKASSAQVATLQASARTRVLELRANPTAEAEAIKLSTLRTLRDENAALLARLEDRLGGKAETDAGAAAAAAVVPLSSLARARADVAAAQAELARAEKKAVRLKQIWSAKSLEFREAVCSVLGWRLDFLPNGRVKATSILYPASLAGDGEEQENSIVFDGENGTMKVSGGPRSVFAGEIRGLIEFWVEGRKDIPCFLAACTLEFYERTTRAQKM